MKTHVLRGLSWIVGLLLLLGGKEGYQWVNTPDPEPSAQTTQILEAMADPTDWSISAISGNVFSKTNQNITNKQRGLRVYDNGSVEMLEHPYKSEEGGVCLTTLASYDVKRIKREFAVAKARIVDMEAKAKEQKELDMLAKILGKPKKETQYEQIMDLPAEQKTMSKIPE